MLYFVAEVSLVLNISVMLIFIGYRVYQCDLEDNKSAIKTLLVLSFGTIINIMVYSIIIDSVSELENTCKIKDYPTLFKFMD